MGHRGAFSRLRRNGYRDLADFGKYLARRERNLNVAVRQRAMTQTDPTALAAEARTAARRATTAFLRGVWLRQADAYDRMATLIAATERPLQAPPCSPYLAR
jgi:hypothetical protein